MKILVTGGCGYKGHVLIPKLLKNNHHVKVIDIQWFGNYLEPNDNLVIIKKDIRDLKQNDIDGYDIIIHLAAVANDPCSDLDPKLSWEVGALSTMRLADFASKSGVKQIIYASSGSVYGVKDEINVTEDLDLDPISEYNKNKMVSERVLLSYKEDMIVQIIRPATVCGLSPRMRLDVAVNLLTMQALNKNEITVLGGEQTRPNIHIDDITDIYLFLIDNPQIAGIYNAGFENISIMDIASSIKSKLNVPITIKESNDPRSYRVDSSKLLNAGFKPSKNVAESINEIIDAYKNNKLQDEDRFYNLRWMQKMLLNNKH